MTPQDQAAKATSAIRYALDELAEAKRDAEAERADPRLLDLAHEIGHARTHLALAARKAAEIVAAPRAAEEGEP